jgi:steroid delta-isomerase-like uncharacterized protein
MSAEEGKAVVRRFFTEILNNKRLGLAEELLTHSYVYHDPSMASWEGAAGLRKSITPYHSAFEDAYWTIDEMFSGEGDMIVTRWTATGTHTAPLMGIPATNRQVRISGIWIHRIVAGKIAESWNVWHMLGMMQQLGVMPEVAPASWIHRP